MSKRCDSRPGIREDDQGTRQEREDRIRIYAQRYAAGLHIYDGTPRNGLKPHISKSSRKHRQRIIRKQKARQKSLFDTANSALRFTQKLG